MNRILFDSSEIGADRIAVVEDGRAEHIRSVLHGTVGQTIKTGTVNGLIGMSEILDVSPTAVALRCHHAEESIRPWIDLILAPPRPRVMKRLLPQLAALGVGRIVLVGAEKVEKAFWGARLLKEEIYGPLLVEGLQQAGTSILPVIRQEKSFRGWMRCRMENDFAAQPLRIVAHPYGVSSAAAVAEQAAVSRPVLAVGPEGGWTEEEVRLLEEKGFLRFSLGSRILRTDTALIALLARLMPHFDNC
ncbi:MAG: 16S rRNA (uracil(1498)-N(3))-methyltransferase [Kiritimatiellia bacterium]